MCIRDSPTLIRERKRFRQIEPAEVVSAEAVVARMYIHSPALRRQTFSFLCPKWFRQKCSAHGNKEKGILLLCFTRALQSYYSIFFALWQVLLQKKLQQSYIILPVSEKSPVIFHFPHFLTALLQIQYCLPDLRGIAFSLLQFINIKKWKPACKSGKFMVQLF